MRTASPLLVLAVVVTGSTFGLTASDQAAPETAASLLQRARVLFEARQFHDALETFDRATRAGEGPQVVQARIGKIRSALRVAEFGLAHREGEVLRADAAHDPEALAVSGDARWAAGLFDEADEAYAEALRLVPDAPRARFGRARSLATIGRAEEALQEALAASADAPDDGEIHAGIGSIYEQLHRFADAAAAYRTYLALLPSRDRSVAAALVRARVEFLAAFRRDPPNAISDEALEQLHTIPFRLERDKIVVSARINGGPRQDVVLDTGGELTVVSRETARRERIRTVASTISAGVGEAGLRNLELARLDSFEVGSLRVRNVPALVKEPAVRGLPRRAVESFSPLAFGLSVAVDYEHQQLTIGRTLPDTRADVRLSMRMNRLPLVRGTLHATHPASFVVDTGGEVISISLETAAALPPSPYRRIPLRVFGVSGWDRDAYLLPGVDLAFASIEYRNHALVVLNLRAPSTLLGFQLGGIVGHTFLSRHRVAMDLEQHELRLTRYR